MILFIFYFVIIVRVCFIVIYIVNVINKFVREIKICSKIICV